MANHDTQILGIGKSFEVLTQVHHAEDIMGNEFPVPRNEATPLRMTLVDGDAEIPFTLRGHGFQWRRDMWRLPSIMGQEKLLSWKFHNVPMFATRARDVTTCLVSAARRGVTLYEPA